MLSEDAAYRQVIPEGKRAASRGWNNVYLGGPHTQIYKPRAKGPGTPGLGAGEGYRSIANIGEEDRQPLRSPALSCKPGVPNPQAIDQYQFSTC